jgi:CRP-like cAMP-binding protein
MESLIRSPRQRSPATIVCRTDCNVLELTESKAKQLYFQDRSFGFAVLQLIISRLIENNQCLRQTDSRRFALLYGFAALGLVKHGVNGAFL